jgi:porin
VNGYNWGDPNDDVFSSATNNQYAIETYYRSQITREFSITPSVQLLISPALNPDKDSLWVFGLRGRFVFYTLTSASSAAWEVLERCAAQR